MALIKSNDHKTNQQRYLALINKLKPSSDTAIAEFESLLKTDGSYHEAGDIACYYKSPMMFIAAEKNDLAKKNLRFIKNQFMTTDGDFNTDNQVKSMSQCIQNFIPT